MRRIEFFRLGHAAVALGDPHLAGFARAAAADDIIRNAAQKVAEEGQGKEGEDQLLSMDYFLIR